MTPKQKSPPSTDHLGAVEALLRNSHELAVNAHSEAVRARDAALKQRLSVLAKSLKDELATVRAAIKGASR